jgi:hypothetical protein
MSFRDATKSQYLGPDRLKPASGTSILRASVEAKRVSDLCTGAAAPDAARERILAWLADGAREVSWALCSFPRDRWAAPPPTRPRSAAWTCAEGTGLHGVHLSPWPALRHARHLALRETYLTLPTVRHALGDGAEGLPSPVELEHADAAWDAVAAIESAEAIVRGLGETRFELLQCLEAAPDEAWERPLPAVALNPEASGVASPIQLDRLMLHARQHELEHLAAIWRVALYWDRASPATVSGRSLQPDERADGLAPIPCRQA